MKHLEPIGQAPSNDQLSREGDQNSRVYNAARGAATLLREKRDAMYMKVVKASQYGKYGNVNIDKDEPSVQTLRAQIQSADEKALISIYARHNTHLDNRFA